MSVRSFLAALAVYAAAAAALASATVPGAVLTAGVLTDTYFVFPDTQSYANDVERGNDLERIAAWLCTNKVANNIQAVLGVGDIVQDGNTQAQWTEFSDVLSALENCANGAIPYIPTYGNHDGDPVVQNFLVTPTNATLYQQNVGKDVYDTRPWFAGRSPYRLITYLEASSFTGRSFWTKLNSRLGVISAEWGFDWGNYYDPTSPFYNPTSTCFQDLPKNYTEETARANPNMLFFFITHSGPCSGGVGGGGAPPAGCSLAEGFGNTCHSGFDAQRRFRDSVPNVLAFLNGHLGLGCAQGGGAFQTFNKSVDGSTAIHGMFDFNSICEVRSAATAYSWTGWLQIKRGTRQLCLRTVRVIDASTTPSTTISPVFDRTDNGNSPQTCQPIVFHRALRTVLGEP